MIASFYILSNLLFTGHHSIQLLGCHHCHCHFYHPAIRSSWVSTTYSTTEISPFIIRSDRKVR